MKLMVCIVNNFYTAELESRMESKGYRMTELSSSGGFLKRGNTTFLFGIEDEQIDQLKKDLKETCISYEQVKGKRAETTNRYTAFVLNMHEALYLSELTK
ncbi:cyclic-di-AMP receptor [Bacillus piscicola]|uniref:cyclic-di-AMP receptor n=1 Tax=Bacillus piscicola TaxID=1632684 RepID=UPI001F09135C|nr:cyclic-di-AMP receptor [Bacillus piscicola]